jgi:hypothetical protein
MARERKDWSDLEVALADGGQGVVATVPERDERCPTG